MIGQNPFDTAIQLVRNHQPQGWYNHERGFRRDLAGYLNRNMNCSVEEEFEHKSLNRDLDIELQFNRQHNIAIELKRDFDRRSFNELSGQLDQYSKDWKYIIACSYGISSEEEWAEIQRNKGRGGWFNKTDIVFIPKRRSNGRQPHRNNRRQQSPNQGRDRNGGIDWSDPFSYF